MLQNNGGMRTLFRYSTCKGSGHKYYFQWSTSMSWPETFSVIQVNGMVRRAAWKALGDHLLYLLLFSRYEEEKKDQDNNFQILLFDFPKNQRNLNKNRNYLPFCSARRATSTSTHPNNSNLSKANDCIKLQHFPTKKFKRFAPLSPEQKHVHAFLSQRKTYRRLSRVLLAKTALTSGTGRNGKWRWKRERGKETWLWWARVLYIHIHKQKRGGA